jgi:hypothetical protein
LRGAAGSIGFVGLPDRGTAVFAPRQDQAAEARTRLAGKKKVELKYKGLKPLLDKMNAEEAVSIAGLGSVVTGTMVAVKSDGANTTRTVAYRTPGEQGIDSTQGGAAVGAEVKGHARLTARSEEAATKLAKGMNDGLGTARAELQRVVEKVPQVAPALTALQRVRITGKGRTITLEGRADAEAVKLLPTLGVGPAAGPAGRGTAVAAAGAHPGRKGAAAPHFST